MYVFNIYFAAMERMQYSIQKIIRLIFSILLNLNLSKLSKTKYPYSESLKLDPVISNKGRALK